MILIGRGLDLKSQKDWMRSPKGRSREVSFHGQGAAPQIFDLSCGSREATFKPYGFETFLCSFQGVVQGKCKDEESEHEGNPKPHTISGDYSLRDPPVPIPNTEVKPQYADGTWLETARESRSSPDSIHGRFVVKRPFLCAFAFRRWWSRQALGGLLESQACFSGQ